MQAEQLQMRYLRWGALFQLDFWGTGDDAASMRTTLEDHLGSDVDCLAVVPVGNDCGRSPADAVRAVLAEIPPGPWHAMAIDAAAAMERFPGPSERFSADAILCEGKTSRCLSIGFMAPESAAKGLEKLFWEIQHRSCGRLSNMACAGERQWQILPDMDAALRYMGLPVLQTSMAGGFTS